MPKLFDDILVCYSSCSLPTVRSQWIKYGTARICWPPQLLKHVGRCGHAIVDNVSVCCPAGKVGTKLWCEAASCRVSALLYIPMKFRKTQRISRRNGENVHIWKTFPARNLQTAKYERNSARVCGGGWYWDWAYENR